MRAAKKNKRGGLRYVLLIILAILAISVYKVFGPNTGIFTQGEYLYIHTGSDYEKVKTALTDGGFVADMFTFDLVAQRAGLPTHIHPGKYKISKRMSIYEMLRMLRNGRQTPVKLVIKKLRRRQDFINLVSSNLEADSTTLKQMMHDPVYLAQFGLDTNTVMCGIIPDNYEFYWNVTADKVFRKIQKNYVRFWDEARVRQAQAQGLTPTKAIVIASIVEEETNIADDKPKIASVYINRLKKGMRLQADPTVKFAIGDFTIRRVTGAMLQTNSPYNTYQNDGLPPGPICTPSTGTVQAVLDAPQTTYLYFCASADLNGTSNFASTMQEHDKNAKAYQKALNERGIH